jgi:hypothetical protein
VRNCILDGEMVGWDIKNATFLPKGMNIDVKSLGSPNDDGVIEVK